LITRSLPLTRSTRLSFLLLMQHDKFQDGEFGRCRRVHCEGQPLLPVGQSDAPRKFSVHLYCPRCNDIYFPHSKKHSSEYAL
jgi:hypothetical protein